MTTKSKKTLRGKAAIEVGATVTAQVFYGSSRREQVEVVENNWPMSFTVKTFDGLRVIVPPERVFIKQEMLEDVQLAVEEALEKLGEAADLVDFVCRETDDEYLRRTVLAQLQGREGGWLGEGVADQLRKKIDQLKRSSCCDAELDEVEPGRFACVECGLEHGC